MRPRRELVLSYDQLEVGMSASFTKTTSETEPGLGTVLLEISTRFRAPALFGDTITATARAEDKLKKNRWFRFRWPGPTKRTSPCPRVAHW